MPSDHPPRIPTGPPLHYTIGGWPHGRVRELTADEGGELVAYQLDQLRAFIAELIEARTSRGITQAHLARVTGLRASTISNLESGKSYPDWHTLARLAYALEADLRFVKRRAVRDEVEGRD